MEEIMAYDKHCMRKIDIEEYEKMYKTTMPDAMKKVINELNKFIEFSSETTIYDYDDHDEDKTFKMFVFWCFRDGLDKQYNCNIASNFEDGNPAYILNENGEWSVRWPMGESDKPMPNYTWRDILAELKMMVTG
jgi:hypothetical protein